MKEKKNTLFVIALLLLVGLTSGYIANTYARYASAIPTKNATAKVAKWNFTGENGTTTLAINLAEAYNASTLIGERIAPGTKGSFKISLKNSTTETGVDFTVMLKEIDGKPTNLKFCKDAACSEGSVLTPGTSTITGQLIAKDPVGKEIEIFWEWPLGNSEEVNDTTNKADTTDGQNATTEGLTIGVDITGVQTAPSTTGFTSHVD